MTDGEKLDPLMFGDKVSIDIVNLAAMKLALTQMSTQERLVIVPWNKADFLAVDFVGDL